MTHHTPSEPLAATPVASSPVTTLGLAIFAVTLLVVGCGSALKTQAQEVQLTASGSDVLSCEHIGGVVLGTFDSEFDQRQRDLKFETARKGGNVLLVSSYAMATSGQAYHCGQPIAANRAAS